MNAEFFQSWKGSLTIAAVVMIAITGYKMAFRPDLETRIAEQRIEEAFPGGYPSPDLLNRQVATGVPLLGLGFTLDTFAQHLTAIGTTYEWEPTNNAAFVLRATRFDPLTKTTNEFAFDMAAVSEGQADFGGKAIKVSGMALNREFLSSEEAVAFMYVLQGKIFEGVQNN